MTKKIKSHRRSARLGIHLKGLKGLSPLCCLIALLGTQSLTYAAGNPKAGHSMAAVCLACHGPQGVSLNPIWPNLAGQREEYLVKQLKDFRAEVRKNAVMTPQAKGLSDADIENLAAYFASLPATPTPTPTASPSP